MARIIRWCPLVAGLFSASILADSSTLSLDQYLRAVLDHNPGVQRILQRPGIAQGEYLASQGIDDLTLRGVLRATRGEPDQIFGFEPRRSRQITTEASVDRLFSNTGTRLRLGVGNTRTRRSPALPGLGDVYYQPSITLRLVQPLLRNARGLQDRLGRELAQTGVALARLETREELESYLTAQATLFLEWYLATREADIARQVHLRAVKQQELVRVRVQRQVAEPFELLRMQESRAGFLARWYQAVGRARGLGQKIRRQMNRGEDSAPIRPADPAAAPIVARHTRPRPVQYLREESRLQAMLRLLVDNQAKIGRAREDARRPELDLVLGYTRHGVNRNFGSGLNGDDQFVGLETRYPLGNRAARGAFRAQLAVQRQIERDRAQRLVDAEAALSDLLEQEKRLTLAVKATRRQVSLAARKLAEEERLYRIGRLDLFQLLQDQTTQLQTRLEAEALAVQLMKMRLNIGELLDLNLAFFGPQVEE